MTTGLLLLLLLLAAVASFAANTATRWTGGALPALVQADCLGALVVGLRACWLLPECRETAHHYATTAKRLVNRQQLTPDAVPLVVVGGAGCRRHSRRGCVSVDGWLRHPRR